jgi:hypothetical protein
VLAQEGDHGWVFTAEEVDGLAGAGAELNLDLLAGELAHTPGRAVVTPALELGDCGGVAHQQT